MQQVRGKLVSPLTCFIRLETSEQNQEDCKIPATTAQHSQPWGTLRGQGLSSRLQATLPGLAKPLKDQPSPRFLHAVFMAASATQHSGRGPASCMSQEVVERTWPLVDHRAGPGQWEAPRSLPSLGCMSAHSSCTRSLFKDFSTWLCNYNYNNLPGILSYVNLADDLTLLLLLYCEIQCTGHKVNWTLNYKACTVGPRSGKQVCRAQEAASAPCDSPWSQPLPLVSPQVTTLLTLRKFPCFPLWFYPSALFLSSTVCFSLILRFP